MSIKHGSDHTSILIQELSVSLDKIHEIYQDLDPEAEARYFRLVPMEYNSQISLKFELYGSVKGGSHNILIFL